MKPFISFFYLYAMSSWVRWVYVRTYMHTSSYAEWGVFYCKRSVKITLKLYFICVLVRTALEKTCDLTDLILSTWWTIIVWKRYIFKVVSSYLQGAFLCTYGSSKQSRSTSTSSDSVVHRMFWIIIKIVLYQLFYSCCWCFRKLLKLNSIRSRQN